jgi:hypothetical protein
MYQRNSWYYCINTIKYLADASIKPGIVTECIIVSVAYHSDWSVRFEDAEMLDMDEKETFSFSSISNISASLNRTLQSEQNSQLQILRLRVQIPPLALSHCDISLLSIRIQFTQTDLCIYTPLWRQNYFESLSLERWLLPPYFWIWFFESGSTLRLYYLSTSYWCE